MAAAVHDELVTLLEEALINTKHVQSAAIVRRRDGQTRARTRGFPKVGNVGLSTNSVKWYCA